MIQQPFLTGLWELMFSRMETDRFILFQDAGKFVGQENQRAMEFSINLIPGNTFRKGAHMFDERKMIDVKSSNIKSVAYVEETMKLYIKFHTKKIYVYSKVPRIIYTSLMISDSKGGFFAGNIKKHFDCEPYMGLN